MLTIEKYSGRLSRVGGRSKRGEGNKYKTPKKTVALRKT